MSNEYGTNRWWENYLVRYLMPSIAGVAIVSWLCLNAGYGFREALLLPSAGKPIDAASLTLIFLYGNLFCYIASYPILVFHVTRVADFIDDKWPVHFWCDGYLATVVLLVATFCLCRFQSLPHRYRLAFGLALLMVTVQIARLCNVFFTRMEVRGLADKVSPAYGFAYALAKRRGISDETETTKPLTNASGEALNLADEADGNEDEVTSSRRIAWRREFIDSYRHQREHGNSAFIFLLEIALAGLAYCVITKPGQSPSHQISALGALFAIWAFPAVFVHLLGQHLERRFSQFDRRFSVTETKS